MKKILLGLLGAIVVLLVVGGAFLALKQPAQRPASTEKVEATAERLKRGTYLVEHVSTCTHCHSTPTWDKFGVPPEPGTLGAGGLCITEKMGFPGQICTPNITPDAKTGLGEWTDGEILRAMREGVDRHGKALFGMMPYDRYREMSDEDAKSILVYIRTLAPVAKPRIERALKPPLNVIVKFMPKTLDGPVQAPDRKDTVAYGKYLVTLASCRECHTPINDKHEAIPGMDFAGGQEFKMPSGEASVFTANITPHATGIGAKTKEEFIGQFRAFAGPEARDLKIDPKDNTPMPWLQFAGMTDEDLGAIYDYLRTQKPVEHVVVKRKKS